MTTDEDKGKKYYLCIGASFNDYPMRKYTAAARMPLWKWLLCLLAGLVVFLLLYGFVQFAGSLPAQPAAQAAVYAGAALLALLLYAAWTNITERRPVTELALDRAGGDLGLGLLTGVGYFAAVVGLIALAGCYRIAETHFAAVPLLVFFLYFFCVAVFEEILFRGILFRLIDDRWNTGAALVVSALLFGAMHLPNPGATLWSAAAIAIEAGLLLGAAYKCSGTLWLPIGIHWAWNFVQGNILGFPVSGTPIPDKLFSAIISGPEWITGGRFGAEASVPAVAVGLLLAIILLLRCKRDER